MAEMNKKSKSHLQTDKDKVWWDWWSENPIEIVLVIFILVLFFALPRQGCGITETGDQAPPTAVEQTE